MTPERTAERLARLLDEHGLTIAVAESLTGGLLASNLARTKGAGGWFRGAVVAYATEVKHGLLDVPPGPVVSEPAASAMASSVAERLGADVGVAVTGVGGPDPQDGIPPGTVWLAVWTADGAKARLGHFDGDPGTVCDTTCDAALALVLEQLQQGEQIGDDRPDHMIASG